MVLATDPEDATRQRFSILFPLRIADGSGGGWSWDGVAVHESEIAGYGLSTAPAEDVDWANLRHPVAIPLLGRETELWTKQEVDIFGRVLQGA